MINKTKLSFLILTMVATFEVFAAPLPVVNSNMPAQAFSGSQVCFDVNLQNTGEPGYGPYYRIFNAQGLSINSMEMFGSALTVTQEGTFESANSDTLTDSVIDEDVTGTRDLLFSTAKLPVGSVVTGGPTLSAQVCLTLDANATIGSALAFNIQPVYEFGDTATGDNGFVAGSILNKSISAVVMSYSYANNAPENERATGPSFSVGLTHIIDVADGKTTLNNAIVDTIDSNLQFTGSPTVTGGNTCNITSQPTDVSPGGSLALNCASATGQTGAGAELAKKDVQLRYNAYVPNILAGNSCAVQAISQSADHDAEFPSATSLATITNTNGFVAKHIATQQSMGVTNPGSDVVPGTKLTITNNIQVSDYQSASALTATDILPDGMIFDTNSVMTINGGTVITPTVTVLGNDTTEVFYDLRATLGADIPSGSSFTVSYDVDIQQSYSASSEPVRSSDNLQTTSLVTYNLLAGANACTDNSQAAVQVKETSSSKTIYTVQGQTPQSEYAPGDVVTFLLTLNVPSGDTKDIVFTDFLPLPVFKVADVRTAFNQDVKLSPADSAGLTPSSISRNTGSNSLIIEWPDLTRAGSQVISVYVDATINDEPFADNLSLTNLFQVALSNTVLEGSALLQNVALTVRAPKLSVTLTDDASATVDAGDVISYVFTATNSGGANAHDVSVEAKNIAGLENAVISDATIDGVSVAYTGEVFDGTFKLTNPLAAGKELVLTFSRTVSATVVPRQVIEVTADATWASLPGNGKPFPPVVETKQLTVGNASISSSVKSITPQGSLGSDFVVGDTVIYELEISLPESTVADLEFQLDLPAGLEYVSGSESVITTWTDGGTITYGGSVDASPSFSSTGTIENGQVVTLAFPSNTVTTGDNNENNNTFKVEFAVFVKDITQNNASAGLQAKNLSAALDFTNRTGTVGSSTSSRFAEHRLTVSSDASPKTALQVGDIVTITLVVENTGNAPAYDVVVSSAVNSALFDLGSIVQGTANTDYTYAYNNPNVNFTRNGGSLAPGDSETLQYTATVKSNVQTGAGFSITGTAVGDSQAGSVVSEQRSKTVTDNVAASTSQPSADSITLSASSEAWTSNAGTPLLAIGEVATYVFTMTLPEGETKSAINNNIAEITLPAGFIFKPGTATVRGVFDSSIISSQGITIASNDQSITPSENGQVLGFNLGDVTVADDDANAEQLIFTVDVIAGNTANNNRTDLKTMTGTVHYLNEASTSQQGATSENANIGESNIAISYLADKELVSGGELITYTIVLTNGSGTNTTRAWDWAISNALPSRLQNPSLVSATLSRGSADILSCASVNANNLSFTSAACLSDAQSYLAAGENVELVFTASMDSTVGFEEAVSSTTNASVTSLPGNAGTNDVAGAANTNTGERTGAGVNNDSGEAVNDLVVMATEVVTSGKPSVNFQVSAAQAQIGDMVSLTGQIAMPTGTTSNFVYQLDLPAGLEYAGGNVSIELPSSDFSTSLTPSSSFVNGTNPLIFDFGDINNSSALAQDVRIIVEVNAANVLTNQAATSLSSTGQVTYQGAATPSPSNSAVVTIVEPNLNIVQTITSGATGSDAGDTVTYSTVITNSANNASAFNIAFADVMPAKLLGGPDGTGTGIHFTNVTVTNPNDAVVLNNTTTALTSNNLQVITTTNTNDTLSAANFDMPASSSITFTYDVVVSNDAGAGEVLNNALSASYASLIGGGGRTGSVVGVDDDDNSDLDNYRETASTALTIDNMIALQSSINDTHINNEFTIGETFSIDLRVDIVEGEVNNLVIINELPDNTRFVSSSASNGSNITYTGSGSGVVSGGNNLTISLGNITNTADIDSANDFLTITLLAVVLNENINTQGSTLTNVARASGGGATTIDSELDIDIVEPALVIAITTDKDTVTLGDSVLYTVSLTPTSTRPNAFDTSLALDIPAGLSFEVGSFMGAGTLDASSLTTPSVDLGTVTTVDGVKSFSFSATVDNDADIGNALVVSVQNGEYSSISGANADERTYALNASKSIVSDNASFISAAQVIELLIDNNSNGLADVGDTLKIAATLLNNGSLVNAVEFTESVPQFTQYVANTLTSSFGTVDDSSNMRVAVGSMATGDIIDISFNVIVSTGVADGTIITAQGQVDSELTIPELTDADNNDANGDQSNQITVGSTATQTNNLYVNQQFTLLNDADASGSISPDDEIIFEYTITNTGSGALSDIVIDDIIAQGLSYVPASVQITGSNSADVTLDNVSATIASLAPGLSQVLRFTAAVDNPLFDNDSNPDEEFFNFSGSFSSAQTPSLPIDSNNDPKDGYQGLRFSAVSGANGETGSPNLVLNEGWYLLVDQDADGFADPGDVIRVTMAARNKGSLSANGITLAHAIPNNTSYVADSATISQGVIVTQQPYSANIGDIAPGQSVTAQFDLLLGNFNNGDVLSLQGSIDGANVASILADNNNDLSDGAQPALVIITTGSSIVSPPALALLGSSDTQTTNNNFVQGETLDVEYTVIIPAGRTQNAAIELILPAGLSYDAGSAQLAATFDTSLRSQFNPGTSNQQISEVFTDVSASVAVSGQRISLALGDIINSDNDANDETYRLRLRLTSSGIVPLAASANVPVAAAFTYNDERIQQQSLSSEALALNLLNRAPTAINDSVSIDEDSSVISVDVLDNDIDLDVGQNISIDSILSVSNGGIVIINATADQISYQAAANFNGTETVRYQIIDSVGATSIAEFTAVIAAVADAPVAVGDTASTSEDTSVTIMPLVNDSDADNDTLSIIAASASTGLVQFNGGVITYTPQANFTGNVSISYTISDSNGGTDSATITMTVTPQNDIPTLNDSTSVTEEDEVLVINGLASANDIDGDVLNIINASATNAQVTISNTGGVDGQLVFTPNADFNGIALITYTISDGQGGEATATVTVTVNAVNDAPTATLVNPTTTEDTAITIDILSNANDVDGDSVVIQSASATNGTVVVNANGTILFTPQDNFNGVAVITLILSDGNGGEITKTISVTVSSINDLPALAAGAFTIEEDAQLTFDVLALASDTDGDVFSVVSMESENGTATLNAAKQLVFTPKQDFNGVTTLTVTIEDAQGGAAQAVYTITVTALNDLPVVEPFVGLTTDLTTPLIIDILGSVSDVEQSDVTISSATSAQGSVTINANGEITFVANPDFEGIAIIAVCVKDEDEGQTCVDIEVNVANPNSAPQVKDIVIAIQEDASVALDLSATDADNDILTYRLTSQPNAGTLIGELPNVIFSPDPNFSGEISFGYVANDGQFDSQIGLITINVGGENDAPVALDDVFELNGESTVTINVLENDYDPDADLITVIGAVATIGDIVFFDDGIQYTPVDGFVGTIIIDYTIADAAGLQDSARVLVTTDISLIADLPIIDVPEDVLIDANALFTKVDLGVASAIDKFGNPLPVSLIDGITFYEPGVNTAFWVAVDSEGRKSIASQFVRVRPLVSFSKNQAVLEGRRVSVGVNLNGTSPFYPLVIPYTVSGTAGAEDHNLVDGELVIESGSIGVIEFETFSDAEDDAGETIILTLGETLNTGNTFEHTVVIAQGNVNPYLSLFAKQGAQRRVLIGQNDGDVVINSTVVHPDIDNEYDYVWKNVEQLIIDIDLLDETFTFDPSVLPVGIYKINASVTDADDLDFSDSETLYLEIVAALPVLGNEDSDGDGIPDIVEGLGDSDRDGIPDYLDPIPECNVLPEEANFVDGYLVEGDPGVCLRIGDFAATGEHGGSKITQQDIINDAMLNEDTEVTNIGGIFDFIAYGLPEVGSSYRIVMPQLRPVPENAVYRKYIIAQNWFTFVETGNNRLWSTAGEPGYCPPPGGPVWTPGLTTGHWCVQIQIVDGGPNDADGVANGTIIDPGGVGVMLNGNSLPVAVNDAIDIRADTTAIIQPLLNDTDADNDVLSIISATANFGTLTFSETEIIYTPRSGFVGVAQILYGISDGASGTDLGEITVLISGNQAPIAIDDVLSIKVNEATQINALINDSDPDSDAITIIGVSATNGAVSFDSANIIAYTPELNFIGIATITYTIEDVNGAQAQAQIAVTVEPVAVRIENKKGGSLHYLLILFSIALLMRAKKWPFKGSSISHNFIKGK